MPLIETCQIDLLKLWPCALDINHETTKCTKILNKSSREWYNFQETCWKGNPCGVCVFYGESLWNGIVFEAGVENLCHMIIGDAYVQLEFFHVTWVGYIGHISEKARSEKRINYACGTKTTMSGHREFSGSLIEVTYFSKCHGFFPLMIYMSNQCIREP
jgi:hypothetical protein